MLSRVVVQNNQSARDKVVAAINKEASYAETYCAKLPAGCPVTFVAASAVAFSPTPAATRTVRTPSERYNALLPCPQPYSYNLLETSAFLRLA